MLHIVNSASIAFVIVDQRPADAVRFPGALTQLVPLGHGEAIAQKWNQEHLAALVNEYKERWAIEDDRVANDGELPDPEVQRLYEEATKAWAAERDAAFAAGERDPNFSRVLWENKNPPPTLQKIGETLGRPMRQRPSEGEKPQPPDPPRGAEVEQIDSAWCARLEGPTFDDSERVLARPGSIPRKGIAQLLSELVSDGWTIVHWSDDRRVIHEERLSRIEMAGLTVVLQRL